MSIKVASLFLSLSRCDFGALFCSIPSALLLSTTRAFLSQRVLHATTRCCVASLQHGRGNRRAKSDFTHICGWRGERFFKLIYRLMVVCLMSAFVSWWPPLNQIFTTPRQRRSRREKDMEALSCSLKSHARNLRGRVAQWCNFFC